MSIREFYKGKTILLTGTTGFIGKVILEKMIREFDFKRIYVMLRPKKTATVEERLKKEVFSSEIFSFLQKQKPQKFIEEAKAKIKPIAGDLIIDKLGLSAEDRAELVSELDVIINCAASVNFDDPLLDAIQINYFGCLRVLKLAKECVKLECLCHVSTAYVNSDKQGLIEEKIYTLNRDPEEIIREILQMNPQYIIDNEKTLIGRYPNTYTYTKSMAERALLKTHGHVRVALIRPSVVISSYEQPYPGWTDTLAAAGGIIFGVTSGLMHVVFASPSNCLDIVPCDYVSNTTLCATAYTARLNKPQVLVCHSSSTHHNPCSIQVIADNITAYAQKFPYYRAFSEAWAYPTGNPALFHSLIFFTETIPSKLFEWKSKMPVLGSAEQREQS